MKVTAIYTANDQTTLTIRTSEELFLEQMDNGDNPIKLNPGVNNILVGAGVFKVRSKDDVQVTADTPGLQVGTLANDKDGGPIDPPMLQVPGLKPVALTEFLLDAKGYAAPQ